MARRTALQVLDDADEHLSVDEIHTGTALRGAPIDVSTAYRTMEWLTANRLAHRLDVPGEARYGMLAGDHHHAVCNGCNRVTDIEPDDIVTAIDQLGVVSGIAPDYNSGLTVRGTCLDCRMPRGQTRDTPGHESP